MDINNVSTFITLDPSKLFNAERFYNRAMVMYEGDEDLVESFLKEHLASDSLAYAMHLLEETSSTSYMGVKIHYNGTSFSAPTAGVYGVKSRPEIKSRIKAKVLKRNDAQNKAASLNKEAYDNTKSPDYDKKKKALAKKHGGEDKIKGHPQYEEAAIDVATEYFYEEGINEDGIDLIIEEVGLENFIEFVIDPPSETLMEERSAVKAPSNAPSYEKVKSRIDKADAKRKAGGTREYAKGASGGDPAPRKKAAKKPSKVKVVNVKKPTPDKKVETQKKVVKSVSKAKTTQPKKPASKTGIRGAIERGIERHKAATKKASSQVKKVVKTAKATAKQHSQHRKDFVKGISPTAKEKKIAKGVGSAVKKSLTREEVLKEEEYDRQKDKHLERGGIGAVASHSDRKPNYGKPQTAAQKKKSQENSKKAFNSVVASLKKKYGDNAVMTKKEEVENDIPNLRARAEETECCSKCGSYKHVTSKHKEVKEDICQCNETVSPPKEDSKVKRQNMLKRQVLMKKLQAVRAGGGSDVVASYSPEGELVTDEYTVTNADKKGNTKAWQNYKNKVKNVKTGKPLYKAADHVKEDSDLDTKFSEVVAENSSLHPQSRAIDIADKNTSIKGKKKGNVIINPEVKTNVDESMTKDTTNLQEVDLNTRSVDYGQEIKNAEPIKKKKPLKDFKKLAGAAAKNKKLG